MLNAFSVGTACAKPGEKATGVLEIPKKFEGEILPVDVVVVNGIKDGPVVYVGAGTHGDEFNSMEACRKASIAIDATKLSGAVIFAPCHNKAALANCCRHSPADGKDLDDCFPGKLDGTASDALAYVIFHEALLKADYMIDMHTASRGGYNLRYGNIVTTDQDDNEKSFNLVTDFGAPVIVSLKMSGGSDTLGKGTGWNYSGNLFVQAYLKGIPSSIIEYGEAGRINQDQIQASYEGVLNMLCGLGMLEDEVVKNNPISVEGYMPVLSEVQGLFYCYAEPGKAVSKGEMIGEVVIYPNEIWQAFSPCDGVILRIATEALVKKGTRLFYVGVTK